jgi:hypothetical protein
MQRRLEHSRAAHPRRHRISRLLIPFWLVYVATAFGFGIADRDWALLFNVLFFSLAFGWPAVRAAQGPRRAVRLNSEASAERG